MIRILKVGLALLMAGSMWYYVTSVLVPYQEKEAAVHHKPRGNLSDPWLWIRGGIIRQESRRTRFLYWITAILFGWQWIGAHALTGTSLFASSSAAQHLPHLPLFALLGLPVAVFFLLALHTTDIWHGRAYLSKPSQEPRGAVGPATASEVGL